MYFGDVYPEPTPEEHRSFVVAERRMVTRLVIVACVAVVAVIVGIAFV